MDAFPSSERLPPIAAPAYPSRSLSYPPKTVNFGVSDLAVICKSHSSDRPIPAAKFPLFKVLSVPVICKVSFTFFSKRIAAASYISDTSIERSLRVISAVTPFAITIRSTVVVPEKVSLVPVRTVYTLSL